MLTRRKAIQYLGYGGAGLMGILMSQKAPAMIYPDKLRPQMNWGGCVGEVSEQGAIFWSKSDVPAELKVIWSLDPDFKTFHSLPTVSAIPQNDLTARVAFQNLPSAQRIFYRAHFEHLKHVGIRSLPYFGEFSSPQLSVDTTKQLSPIRFAWSGDSFGQGYGINPQMGGVKIYDTIRSQSPQFFIHCGDRIYADQPLDATKSTPDGQKWYNLITPAVSKVAQELDDFRGYYQYAMLDQPTQKFYQLCPQLFAWDDHETKNDWFPGKSIDDGRYQVKDCSILAQRSKQAFFEYAPLSLSLIEEQKIYRKISYGPMLDVFMLDGRSYRGNNDRDHHDSTEYGKDQAFLGETQLNWLIEEILQSKATWKVLVFPQPISLLIGTNEEDFDGIGNQSRVPAGRELEILKLLSSLYLAKVKNIVSLSADVHYAAAFEFLPEKAHNPHFFPFWEFIAGPINAATLSAKAVDSTFGATQRYLSVKNLKGSHSPLEGMQFYGLCEIHPETQNLKVSLHSLDGDELYAVELKA
jgi:alkaline phosphatase D